MNFLFDTCSHPTVLRILYFAYLFLDILFVAIPIGLIIMLMIDFSKAVIAGKEDEQIKSTKLVTKRIMYAVIIFVMPWIVGVVMSFAETVGLDTGGNFMECLTNVEKIKDNKLSFEFFDEMYELSEKVDKNNSSDDYVADNTSGTNASAEDRLRDAANQLISTAKLEIGKTDRTKYGVGPDQGWCAAFVSWSLKNSYIENRMTESESIFEYINRDGYVSNPFAASGLWGAFKKSNHLDYHLSKYYGGNYTPKKGDIVWFQWDNSYCVGNFGVWDKKNECSDHTAIIIEVNGDSFTTIDGNSGGQVKLNSRNVNSKNVIAYGSWYK